MSITAKPAPDRRVKAFLCHASEDKPVVKELYRKLQEDGFEPWLDQRALHAGELWERKIFEAIRSSDAFLVCLSQSSPVTEGFVNREIAYALEIVKNKPEDAIFIIPIRLDHKVQLPTHLSQWQSPEFFTARGYQEIVSSLRRRAEQLGASDTPPVVLQDNALVSSSSGTPIPIMHPIETHAEGIFEELKAIQQKLTYLPEEELRKVAERRNLQVKDVREIAAFYHQFRLEPPATVDVGICDDMACHLRGALELRQRMEQRLRNVSAKDLTFRNVSCLGRCDQAPAFVINDRYYNGRSSDKAVDIVLEALPNGLPGKPFAIDPYDGRKSYEALRNFVQTGKWDRLSEELKMAGLLGMGGAGFPTWMKWDMVRKTHSTEKYVVCNANGSEPGSVKDRFILAHLPNLVIEGLALAGLFAGAKRGYLCVRNEYQDQIAVLRSELELCHKKGLIGEDILGSGLSFDITLFISPSGYICGEESALLEAIEGKRAQPRDRPPFIAMVGLWGKPTVVNNVETLVFAAAIAAKGGAWFNSHGANGYKGLKFVSVSGDVQAPGVFEVSMGTTYEDLIYKYAKGLPPGRDLVAFAPSGPSSGYLPASKVNLPLDPESLRREGSMVGSGAVVVCATGTCMLDMALNAVRFYRNESCGKCVPCRSGSGKLVEVLQRWIGGNYEENDLTFIKDLFVALRTTSICGLGQILPMPIESVLRHFRAEVDEHILNRRCPAGVCFRDEKMATQISAGHFSMVQLNIDGQSVSVPQGTTILEAARQLNIDIPAPCRQQEGPLGGCRLCIVEMEQKKNDRNIYQSRPYATACTRRLDQAQDQDLVIRTNTSAVQGTRKTLLGLIMADHQVPCQRQMERGDCELERLAVRLGVTRSS